MIENTPSVDAMSIIPARGVRVGASAVTKVRQLRNQAEIGIRSFQLRRRLCLSSFSDERLTSLVELFLSRPTPDGNNEKENRVSIHD